MSNISMALDHQTSYTLSLSLTRINGGCNCLALYAYFSRGAFNWSTRYKICRFVIPLYVDRLLVTLLSINLLSASSNLAATSS